MFLDAALFAFPHLALLKTCKKKYQASCLILLKGENKDRKLLNSAPGLYNI